MRGNQKSRLGRKTNSTHTPKKKPAPPLRSAIARPGGDTGWPRFVARLARAQAERQHRLNVASSNALRQLCEKMDEQRAIRLHELFGAARTRVDTLAQLDALAWFLHRGNFHLWKVDTVTWIRSEPIPVDESDLDPS